jgi:hypothetical protein
MTRYFRLLTSLIGLLGLCLTQLATTAHAGFSGATLRVNLSVTTASPAAQGTVVGSFTYGVTCTAASGPVLTFAPPAFTLAISAPTPAANSGNISSDNQSISSPNTCTFTQLSRPTPPAGYVWNGSPPAVTVSNINLTDPPLVYAAAFPNELSLPTVTGVANPPAGGTVSCTPLTTPGANSTCTATANQNFVFAAFVTSGCGGPSGSSPYITSSPILENCTVTGSFSPLYTVTANVLQPAGGTAFCTSPIAAGTFSTCTATANPGYTLAGFAPTNALCGSPSTTSPHFTAPLSANCVMNVVFTQNPVTVTGTANPTVGGDVNCVAVSSNGGSIASQRTKNAVVVTPGQQSRCTATANTGYTFAGFTTSGCGAAAMTNPYLTSAVTADCTVTAAFTQNTFPVTSTVNVPAGGSVTCTPSPVVSGNAATCSVVTNAGYTITSVSGCGGAFNNAVPRAFVTAPVTAACTVSAVFAAAVVIPTGPAAAVPTLGGWMLILLALVVLSMGVAFSARRAR